MGESASARTERELAELRGQIDDDVATLVSQARRDLDPRALARRQPAAVFGTLASVGVLIGATVVKKARDASTRRPMAEIDKILDRLSSRAGKITGRARKRLRERLREEVAEAEKPKRTAGEAAWTVSLAALTAGAMAMARRFAARITGDETVPSEAERSRR